MKIHNKLIKSKQVAENTDLCGNFIHYNFDQNGPPYIHIHPFSKNMLRSKLLLIKIVIAAMLGLKFDSSTYFLRFRSMRSLTSSLGLP